MHYLACLILLLFPLAAYSEGAKPGLEKMQQLYHKAEQSMQKKHYREAKEAYDELIRLDITPHVDLSTYADIMLQLASAERQLNQLENAERRISSLRGYALPDHLHLRVEILLARLKNEQRQPGAAFSILYQLAQKIALDSWNAEEQVFYMGLEYLLNQYYKGLIGKAKRAAEATLFQEAAEIYHLVLKGIENNSYPAAIKSSSKNDPQDEFLYPLAEVYIHSGKQELALALIKPKIEEWEALPSLPERAEKLSRGYYLQGQIYAKNGEYLKAIESLSKHLSLEQSSPYEEEVLWEVGLSYYHLNEVKLAEDALKKLLQMAPKLEIERLANLYLAKLALHAGKTNEANDFLDKTESRLSAEDPFRFEIAFLRAEAAVAEGAFEKAAVFFEKSLPKHNKKLAEWCPKAFYNLGWSYLKLSEQCIDDPSMKKNYLSKSSQAFKELIELPLSQNSPSHSIVQKGYLALGRVFLLKYQSGEGEAKEHLDDLLGQKERFTASSDQAEALLIRCEAAAEINEKEIFYHELIGRGLYEETPAYKKGLYYRAMDFYRAAEKLDTELHEERDLLLTKSAELFEKAFQLLHAEEPAFGALALKYCAEAHYRLSKTGHLNQAFEFLDQLKNSSTLFAALKEPEEILYAQGLIAAQLYEHTSEITFRSIAEANLKELISNNKEKLIDKALFILASMYYKKGDSELAKPLYLTLATGYPTSAYAAEAWFWAADCAENCGEDDEEASKYRKEVYHLYPESSYAPEAYFRTYSFADYLLGDNEALNHLKELPNLFPESPFKIISSYLLALEAKEERKTPEGQMLHPRLPEDALSFCEQAQETFHYFYNSNLIPLPQWPYFATIYYRSLLEEALLALELFDESPAQPQQESYLNLAHEKLTSILADFNEETSPYLLLPANGELPTLLQKCKAAVQQGSCLLKRPIQARSIYPEPYPFIQEESEFALAHAYLKKEEEDKAEECFQKIISKNAHFKIASGYYLSQAWQELAKLAMKKQCFQTALERLEFAEKAGKNGILNVEQKLELWIQKSSCYLAVNDKDRAMLMLSHVINENASSGLRIKAMIMRADIYALQNRHELAIKQLEAASTKGSEWSRKASEKLRLEYGFN